MLELSRLVGGGAGHKISEKASKREEQYGIATLATLWSLPKLFFFFFGLSVSASWNEFPLP